MTVGYVVLIGTVTLFGGAALFAFWWALKTGQFDHPDKQATSIFGPDEPIGMMTDDVLDGDRGPRAAREAFRRAERDVYGEGFGEFRR